jgi:hypothetical protein
MKLNSDRRVFEYDCIEQWRDAAYLLIGLSMNVNF